MVGFARCWWFLGCGWRLAGRLVVVGEVEMLLVLVVAGLRSVVRVRVWTEGGGFGVLIRRCRLSG